MKMNTGGWFSVIREILTVADQSPVDEIWRRIRVHLTADAERTSLDDGVFALHNAHRRNVCKVVGWCGSGGSGGCVGVGV